MDLSVHITAIGLEIDNEKYVVVDLEIDNENCRCRFRNRQCTLLLSIQKSATYCFAAASKINNST
jgi:hypothetical protein